jgi:hypothetical protein
MLHVAYIALLCVVSASNGPFLGSVPENVPTFKINFSNDATDYYGALRTDTGWLMDAAGPGPDLKRAEIVFDTPWAPRENVKTMLSRVHMDSEAPALRRKRLEEGWAAAGYVFLATAQGERPVLKTDIELAKRARDMAADVEAELHPTEKPATEAAQAASSPQVTATPPLWRQWGGHVLLLLAGAGIIAIVLKTLVFAK